MEPLYLVQNDRLPAVLLRLTNKRTGAVIDLSAGTTTVQARLRAAGSSALKETIAMTKPNGGADGVARLDWSATALDTPGDFEAEIEVSFDGQMQTVYDVLPLNIRPQFG